MESEQYGTDMALEHIRVLDLTMERGLYAGKQLADLGADVIKVEPLSGCQARYIGPFKNDIPDIESSLYFINFNTNKRSITLNLRSREGQEIFKKLVVKSDVIIDDFQPGTMEIYGLGYTTLRGLNKGIIVASITGFGRKGPYCQFKAPDIVSFAMGGSMFVSGTPSKPPVVAPAEQAYQSASRISCFGILVALYNRLIRGTGQLVEVSAQEVVAAQEQEPIIRYGLNAEIMRRYGSQHITAPARTYHCKDGYVYLIAMFLEHWKALLELLGNPETLLDEAWESITFRRINSDIIDPIVSEFTGKYTKEQVTQMCQERRIPCTPVYSPEEFANDAHIQERELVVQVNHPKIGQHGYILSRALTESPCQIRRHAPVLGQHNYDVYCQEFGYSVKELERFKSDGVI